jgi:branched-chain amino acid aminotransferase
VEPLVSLDGTITPAAEARVPVTDDGLLRGDGVFEVTRVYGGVPFAWADHLARMEGSARALRLPLDTARLDVEARALLTHAGAVDATLRAVVTRGGRRLVFVEPLPDLPAALALHAVTYSPTRLLDGVKSLSYAANMLATRIAREEGADEALLVTPHGRVLEAPTASFFAVLGGDDALVTPPLSDRILDSITRRRLIAVTAAVERVLTRDDIAGMSEAFVASSVREVIAVSRIDGRALPAVPGPRTTEAGAAFRAHIADEVGRTRGDGA